jgi:polar amino acid transport system permease protein
MLQYDWAFGRIAAYSGAFASGVLITILLSLATITFSLVLGAVWGVALTRYRLLRSLSLAPLDILRSLPPLVLVLFGYFFLSPSVIGFSVSTFFVFTVFVGLNVAAFVADAVRSAITNVPREYIQLAAGLALNDRQILRYVIAPIAIRELIPPLAYLGIETVKLTSLASIINVREMVYVAQGVIVETSRSLEVWVIVSCIYIALIWPSTLLVRRIEASLKRTAGLMK